MAHIIFNKESSYYEKKLFFYSLKGIAQLLHNPHTIKQIEPVSMIIHGATGTGKTTFARAALQKLNVPYLIVNGACLENEYINSGQAGLARIAKIAIDSKMAVIVDNFDSLARKKQSRVPQALKQFIDLLESNKVIFIGIAEHITDFAPVIRARIPSLLYEMPKRNRVTDYISFITHSLDQTRVDSLDTIKAISKITAREKYNLHDINSMIEGAREIAAGRNDKGRIITFEDFKQTIKIMRENAKLFNNKETYVQKCLALIKKIF